MDLYICRMGRKEGDEEGLPLLLPDRGTTTPTGGTTTATRGTTPPTRGTGGSIVLLLSGSDAPLASATRDSGGTLASPSWMGPCKAASAKGVAGPLVTGGVLDTPSRVLGGPLATPTKGSLLARLSSPFRYGTFFKEKQVRQ